jgi:hypothetical protein
VGSVLVGLRDPDGIAIRLYRPVMTFDPRGYVLGPPL